MWLCHQIVIKLSSNKIRIKLISLVILFTGGKGFDDKENTGSCGSYVRDGNWV